MNSGYLVFHKALWKNFLMLIL